MPRWIGALLIVSTIFAVPLATVIAPNQQALAPVGAVSTPEPVSVEYAGTTPLG